MRQVREFLKEDVKVTVFFWNNKYLIKFEQGPLEQTFKVSEYDILEESDLDRFSGGKFFELVRERFKEMGLILQKEIENI